jgi:hypothetical protein
MVKSYSTGQLVAGFDMLTRLIRVYALGDEHGYAGPYSSSLLLLNDMATTMTGLGLYEEIDRPFISPRSEWCRSFRR